jgi:hypothetical protein
MGPPEGPPNKKPKRLTPLETRLEKLRKTLAGLRPIWETFDPGMFMKQMHHTREQLNALTPETINEFISTGQEAVFDALDDLDVHLQEEIPSTSPYPPGLYQQRRSTMSDFVGRVREALRGQSSVRVLRRC